MLRLELVNNENKYYEFISELRTNPLIEEGFTEKVEEISAQQQKDYMKKYAKNYFVCLSAGEPVGYVGEIDGDIRVATHPNYQGLGVGYFMINELMKKSPSAYAKVKIENEASLKLFEKCGFEKKYYILERLDATQPL